MPTITKRATGYQCKVRLKGHEPESQIFDTKAKATAWGYAREAQLKEQTVGIHKATFQEVLDRYIKDVCPTHKSGDNMTKRIKALARVPGLLPTLKQVADVSAVDMSKFRDTRLKQVSIATVRKEMNIIRSVLESARRDWGLIEVNPIVDVKRPPAPPDRKRLMSDDEKDLIVNATGFKDVVTTLQHQVAIAVLLALETAMRAGEMLDLTWDRVYLEAQYMSLPETKNGDQRDVPLSDKAIALITKLKGLDGTKVFTITSASLDALFRKMRNKCKIVDLHFHDTRATALTNLSKKLDVLELARMVGHRDIRSLMIYYRPTATTIASKLN